MKNFLIFLFGAAFGMAALVLVVNVSPTDNSDKDSWHRSGARGIVDYKTGINYLAGSDGGITPRLTTNGSLFITK